MENLISYPSALFNGVFTIVKRCFPGHIELVPVFVLSSGEQTIFHQSVFPILIYQIRLIPHLYHLPNIWHILAGLEKYINSALLSFYALLCI